MPLRGISAHALTSALALREHRAGGAAVILKSARRVPTLAEGVDLAMKSLESGAARAVLAKRKR